MLTVCRICLASNIRLRPVQSKLLIGVYDLLSNSLFNTDDARPKAVCCFCYQRLLKCYTFSKMAQRSEDILNQLFRIGALAETDDAIANLKINTKYLSVSKMPAPTTIYDSIENSLTTVKKELDLQIDSEGFVKEETIVQRVTINNKTAIEVSVPPLKESVLVKVEPIEVLEREIENNYGVNQESMLVEVENVQHDNTEAKNINMKPSESNITFSVANFFPEKSNYTKKTHTCSVCNKIFCEKSRLVRHMRIHTGEKPFVCSICREQFTQKANLSRHFKIHTGEKPFSCSICNKSFRQNSHLAHHMRSHTGEKPNACTLCDKQFRCKGHLADHMRIHTGERPFSCSVCNKQFIHKSDMGKHMRIHTGEKPYACSMCDKKFSQKGHLVDHMRTHTGEKPYACTICSISFRHKSCLVKHNMKNHESDG